MNTYYISARMQQNWKRAEEVVTQALSVAQQKTYPCVSVLDESHEEQQLAQLQELAGRYSPTTVILVGIGGSHIGAQALYDVAYACAGSSLASLLCVTSIDGTHCQSSYRQACDIIHTTDSFMLVVVSKSGTTFETALHAHGLYQQVVARGLQDRIVVITDTDSALAARAHEYGVRVMTIPADLGGRFSVLSTAGCGVLALCGMSVAPLRSAASAVSWADVQHTATFWYAAWLAGYRVQDSFTFIPAYESVGRWMRQLMGESLGKSGKGFLPTVSVGSSDLHSVVQYYLDGPSLVATQFLLPAVYSASDISGESFFLHTAHIPKNISFSHLHKNIVQSVLQTYEHHDRPYLVYLFTPGNSADVATWMQARMMEIIVLSYCLGVNPFDQPQVQDYKERVRNIWA